MARTALFDLDGTLLDSSPGILTCMHHGLGAVGVTTTDAAILELVGIPLQDMFAKLGTPFDLVDTGVSAYRELYGQGEMFNCLMFEGIAPLLSALRNRGWTLAVATSKPTHFALPTVEHFDLAQYFDLVAGATLDGARRHKADVIAFALNELEADPAEVVMIGDRSEDLNGGHANGTQSIGVTWGFGTRGELVACNPLAVVDTAVQLSEVLES